MGLEEKNNFFISNSWFTFIFNIECSAVCSKMKSCLWNFLKNQNLMILPVIFGLIFYLLSLEGCDGPEVECLDTLLNFSQVELLMALVFLSSLFYTVSIWLIFHKILPKKIFILVVSLIIMTCFIYDTGTDLKKHGGYNRILFGIFILFCNLIFSLLHVFHKILSKIKCELFLSQIIFLLFILAPCIFFENAMYKSCDFWEKGFKNSKIDNSVGCSLKPPNYCIEYKLNGIMDISKYLGDTCEKIGNNDKGLIAKFTNVKDPVLVGYPLTAKWNFGDPSLFANYPYSILKNLLDLNNPEVYKNSSELVEVHVDFKKTPAQVVIDVKRNETLAKQRREILSEDSETPNIFMMFIDSVSRNNVRLKLPKLYSYLEKFYESDSSIPYEAFQFLKFHGLGPTTNPNLVPMFAGVKFRETDRGDPMIKLFKEKGFVTGTAFNECTRELLNFYENSEKFGWEGPDHEFNSLFCDPNYLNPENRFTLWNGAYSPRIKCLYEQPTFSYVVNYTNQFWEKYKGEKKFFRAGNINAHEGTDEVIKYDDDLFVKFFEEFELNGNFENTMVIIFSDHDSSQPYLRNNDHVYELYLPFLTIILPKKMENFDEVKAKMKFFENRLITPFDIEKTLLGNIEKQSEFNKQGRNFFDSNDLKDRTCSDFSIPNQECRCKV